MHSFEWPSVAGFRRRSEPKVKKVMFGDGYEQRSPDGINHKLRQYSSTYRDEAAIIQDIDDFLNDRGGVEAFLFIPHGEFVPKTVKCEAWDIVENGKRAELTATFKEVIA